MTPTATLSVHARQRCEEMGIRTKRVKRVVRDPDLVYAAFGDRRVMCRFDEPDFRVIVAPIEHIVITVIPWTYERYDRPRPAPGCS